MPPEVLLGLSHERRVAEIRGEARDRGHAGVGREEERLREVVRPVERLGTGADGHDHAERARAERPTVVDGGLAVQHLAVVVTVGDVLGVRVVLAVVEVPSRDVVGVAVAVVVDAVATFNDEVLGIEVAVAVVVGCAREIEDVEPRVAVVLVARRAGRVGHHLGAVDVDLLDQLVGAVPPVVDAALDVPDDDVRPALAREVAAARGEPRPVRDVLPRGLERHARRAFLVLRDRILGGVDDAPEAVLPSLGRGVGVLGKGGHGGRRSQQPDDGRSEGARSHGADASPRAWQRSRTIRVLPRRRGEPHLIPGRISRLPIFVRRHPRVEQGSARCELGRFRLGEIVDPTSRAA